MTRSLAWFYLTLAILTEVAGITSMKLSNGFTELKPSILIFVFYVTSLMFLTQSLKRIEIGFAYAVWSGVGTLLVFVIAVFFLAEPITVLKVFSLLLILIGVLGLSRT